eukprot:5486251-Pleurochrysis_carterae.AAC.12
MSSYPFRAIKQVMNVQFYGVYPRLQSSRTCHSRAERSDFALSLHRYCSCLRSGRESFMISTIRQIDTSSTTPASFGGDGGLSAARLPWRRRGRCRSGHPCALRRTEASVAASCAQAARAQNFTRKYRRRGVQ